MSPKEYLSQIRHLDKEIDTRLKLIEDTRTKALSVGKFSTEPRSDCSSNLNFTDWVDKLTDMEKDINRKIDELISLKVTINRQIDKMNNPLHRIILFNHYVRDINLRDIAAQYTYDYSYIKHAHGYALLEFKRCNPEVFK